MTFQIENDIKNSQHLLVGIQARRDLIAVGYALQGGFGPHRPGHIALWSLRNPCWPAWHFSTTSGVASLDFSRQSPHLLAVGLQDGTVQLHDVKSRQVRCNHSRVQCMQQLLLWDQVLGLQIDQPWVLSCILFSCRAGMSDRQSTTACCIPHVHPAA